MTEIHAVDDTSPVSQPRLIVNDATVEKLDKLLNENPRGLLLVRDELAGFLSRMEREEYQSERAFYLDAYNGDGQFTYDRIGRGTIHIQNATLSMIGGIQPSRIAPLIANALSGKGDDGLIQRLQSIIWPDDVQNWQWTDQSPNSEARQTYQDIFRSLYQKPLSNPENPITLRFSPQTQGLFRHWMTDLQVKARDDKIAPTLEAHFLKMPKTAANDKPERKKFKIYPIGYSHIDIAQLHTRKGTLYMFVAIDRTSKFALVELVPSAGKMQAAAFLNKLIKTIPYKITSFSQIMASNSTLRKGDRFAFDHIFTVFAWRYMYLHTLALTC